MTRPVYLQLGSVAGLLGKIDEREELPAGAEGRPQPKLYESFSWAGADYEVEPEVRMESSPGLLDQLASWILSDGATASAEQARLQQHFGGKEAPALSPEADARRQGLLAARLTAMEGMTQHEVLGLSRGAAAVDVHRAYLAIATELGLDLHDATASAKLKALAQELLARVQTAADLLGCEVERALRELPLEPDQGPAPTQAGESRTGESRVAVAADRFQAGAELLRRECFPEALGAFREAAALDTEQGTYQAYLGWSLYRTDADVAGVVRRSIDHLEQALQLSPKGEEGHLFLGHVYRETGRLDEAAREYEAAIRANPACREAVRELGKLTEARQRYEASRGARSRHGGRPLP